MSAEHFIPTQTHGRYLFEAGEDNGILLIGLHGYTEDADIQMTRLKQLEIGTGHRCSIQGLHQFYKQNRIAASWMTSQARDLSINNNVSYINSILDHLSQTHTWKHLIFAGFSQGAAMAYRAAAIGKHPAKLLLINGGDIPPDLNNQQLSDLCPTLVIAGDQDQAYNSEQMLDDQKRVKDLSQFSFATFTGPHSWPSTASDLCNTFIQQNHL